MRVGYAAALLAVVASALAMLPGCVQPRTQVVVVVDTDLRFCADTESCGEDLTSVTLFATLGASPGLERMGDPFVPSGPSAFPFVTAIDLPDEATTLRVVAFAELRLAAVSSMCQLEQRASVRVSPATTTTLRMFLTGRCLGVACGDASTCADGACVGEPLEVGSYQACPPLGRGACAHAGPPALGEASVASARNGATPSLVCDYPNGLPDEGPASPADSASVATCGGAVTLGVCGAAPGPRSAPDQCRQCLTDADCWALDEGVVGARNLCIEGACAPGCRPGLVLALDGSCRAMAESCGDCACAPSEYCVSRGIHPECVPAERFRDCVPGTTCCTPEGSIALAAGLPAEVTAHWADFVHAEARWNEASAAIELHCDPGFHDDRGDCAPCISAPERHEHFIASPTGDACASVECAPLWGDCNDDPSDGCESWLGSAARCGACDVHCASGERCSTTCSGPSCASPEHVECTPCSL